MTSEESCCCDSGSESECGNLEFQSKRLHEFEQGVNFWCRFERFDACNGGLRQTATLRKRSLADAEGGAPLNHRRNNSCNFFNLLHTSTALCVNGFYMILVIFPCFHFPRSFC
nr:MAG TPA: hypothetical protein [Caudoviricetes sp.]